MNKHRKIYANRFDLTDNEPWVCEVCGRHEKTDIHHIEARGMGGSKRKDHIENLMSLCRGCHEQFGDKDYWELWLKKIHKAYLEYQVPYHELNPYDPTILAIYKRKYLGTR